MNLVIVESPTKAKALRGFRPTYHLRKGARKVVKRLREAAGEAAAVSRGRGARPSPGT